MSDSESPQKNHLPVDRDSRSTPELIAAALVEMERSDTEDMDLLALASLRFRATPEVFDAAKQLSESLNPQERVLGVQILSQLGLPLETFAEGAIAIFLELFAKETHPDVLCSLCFACGHRKATAAIPILVSLKNNESADVREGVVFGLLDQEDERAIQALIELSAEENYEVRNWATFGLGSMLEGVDTPEIREALWQRLQQEEAEVGDEIYGEALVGLATRKDERVIPLILQELTADSVGYLAVEAAEVAADPRLYEALVDLREWWEVSDSVLEGAIAACRPKP